MEVRSKKQLSELGRGYRFSLEIERIARAAAAGEEWAFSILTEMLVDCSESQTWFSNSYWCSAAIRALVYSRSRRGLNLIADFIQELGAETTYGCIELLAGLLPIFGREALPVLRRLADAQSSGPARAIGIQALCNMFLEGSLGKDDQKYLLGVAENFQSDPYLTAHVLELIEGRLRDDEGLASDSELDNIMKDVIVESQ